MSLFVDGGGASPMIVPVVAEGGSGRIGESAIFGLLALGFGAIPKNAQSAVLDIVGLLSQA